MLRTKEKEILSTYFNPIFVCESEIRKSISDILPSDIPIVSLDNLFLKRNSNTFFLDFSIAANKDKFQLVPRFSSKGKTVESMIAELVLFLKKRGIKDVSLFDMSVYEGVTLIQLQEILKTNAIKIKTAYCVFAHRKALPILQKHHIKLKYKYLIDADIVDEHDFFILPQAGKSFFYNSKEVKLVLFSCLVILVGVLCFRKRMLSFFQEVGLT